MKSSLLTLLFLLSCQAITIAQTDTTTVWFDQHWNEQQTRRHAAFYRKQWKEDGKWQLRTYYLSGNLQRIASTLDDQFNVFDGPYQSYYENGSPWAMGAYLKGKSIGNYKSWFEDGTLDMDVNYIAGKYDGVCRWYYPNGRISSEEIYRQGTVVKATFFSEDGLKSWNVSHQIKEEESSFPGDISEYMHQNMRYPESAVQRGIEGVVIVLFRVYEDGSVHDVAVMKSLDPALDAEAIRLVSNMPLWRPANAHNRKVKEYHNLGISFRFK